MSVYAHQGTLSIALKRALVILLEDGSVMKVATGFWFGKSERKIFNQTILSLYDRYLIKIVVESRYRRRHTAALTEVGEYAAMQIRLELDVDGPLPKVSEEYSKFVAQVVA